MKTCYVEWYEETAKGTVRRQKNLGHDDEAKARLAADALAGALGSSRSARPNKVEPRGTVGGLLQAYLNRPERAEVSKGQRDFESATAALLSECWGRPTYLADLDLELHWDKYKRLRYTDQLLVPPIYHRTSGPGSNRKRKPIRPRTINRELGWIKTIIRWGIGHKHLSADPFTAGKFVKRDARQIPILVKKGVTAIANADIRVPEWWPLLILLADVTGRRRASLCGLVWGDFLGVFDGNKKTPQIRFRPELDKTELDHVVPIPSSTAAALRSSWRAAGKPEPTSPVFPSPKDPTRAVRPDVAGKMFRRAAEATGLYQPRTGFHATRRKANSEMRHLPAVDRAYILGYTDPTTPARIYDQPDDVDLRAAMNERGTLRKPMRRK